MDMNIGARLDEAMKDAKIESQSQLARSSGVPQPTINRILKGQGKQGPETATLLPLARALSVELRWLQTGQGPKRAGDAPTMDEEAGEAGKSHLRVIEPPAAKLQWITEQEAELLSEFRACAEPQKRSALNALRGLPKAIAARNLTAGDKS